MFAYVSGLLVSGGRPSLCGGGESEKGENQASVCWLVGSGGKFSFSET